MVAQIDVSTDQRRARRSAALSAKLLAVEASEIGEFRILS
jgi:hypothetical protein